MKKKNAEDRTCRLERGGCGREVVVTVEPYEHTFGGQTASKRDRQVAVHIDELKGRATAKVVVRRFYTLRNALETRCAALRENTNASNASQGLHG